jgi:hypothetical protein
LFELYSGTNEDSYKIIKYNMANESSEEEEKKKSKIASRPRFSPLPSFDLPYLLLDYPAWLRK